MMRMDRRTFLAGTAAAFVGVPALGARAAYAKQAMRDALVEHRQYITERGEDHPNIVDWRWGGGPSGQRRTSTEGDNA